jgi:hypothetical protein
LGLGLIHERALGAKTGRGIGLPTLHLDDLIVDIKLECADKPQAELAKRESMPHR